MATLRFRSADVFSGLTMLLAVTLLVLVVLSMTGAISLCGKRQRSGRATSPAPRKAARIPAGAACGGNSPMPAPAPAAAPAPAPAQEEAAPAQPATAARAGSANLLDMDAPQALEAVRASNQDKVLYVLGQMSCPACQACKRYLGEKGYGDVSVFVDISAHSDMLGQNSRLPRGVVQSLGRGVPCLVAYSHRAGAVMKKMEGFSPKAVDELANMCRG
jgi:glutaredoxin